jgi:hypothetical protein
MRLRGPAQGIDLGVLSNQFKKEMCNLRMDVASLKDELSSGRHRTDTGTTV